MNQWEVAAAVLGFAAIACVPVAFFSKPSHGLVALEVAGTVLCTILMLLAEGFHRQPFIDLAVVFALMSIVGALTFARLMERDL